MVSYTEGRWRLIYRARAPKTSELYDKWQDPLEQQNVAEDWPEVFEDLTVKAEAYLASRPPPWGDDAPTVEIDEMQLHQLRALGYGVQ
jgi:arylsulfatase A-like enzyme